MKNDIFIVLLLSCITPATLLAKPAEYQVSSSSGNTYGTEYGIYQNPSRLLGRDGTLTIQNQSLTGHLGGGGYQVAIGGNEVRGTGPAGPIYLRITSVPMGHEVQGVWNGGTVHFVLSETVIKGRAMRRISNSIGYRSCTYDLERIAPGPVFSGTVECMGQGAISRFELNARWRNAVSQGQNMILLLAYLIAPAPALAR